MTGSGSVAESPVGGSPTARQSDAIDKLLLQNRQWAASQLAEDPNFFKSLEGQQNPEYLWIGCSDSRVPANQILGLAPGKVFVQRNVGNQATHTDLNVMSCVEYAVQALKVQHIIVCGHYNCGAVKAALQLPAQTPGLVNCWISDIRECRNQHSDDLRAMGDAQARADLLVELNVKRQVFHVATSPVVQAAWASGQQLALYGMVYSLKDGLLRKLVGPIARDDQLMEHSESDFVHSGCSFVCPKSGVAVKVSSGGDMLQDPRTGKAVRLSHGSDGSMEESIVQALDTQALIDKMQCHLSWGQGCEVKH